MKKFQLTALILAVLSLILIGVSTLVQNSLAGKLDTQDVCSRWVSDGTKYAQLSAFISPHAGFDESSADHSLPSALDTALVSASISAADDDARLYAYAYSAEASASMSMQSPETGMTVKSGVSATATGVGADFFLFHPLKLLSGQYFDTADTVLNDLIIIDNNLAWQFFGSPDVVGRELIVNGKICHVSGVCEVDPDYEQFYGEAGRVYMSYSLLKELQGDLPITCYELCMPNPVSGFAADILAKNIGLTESYYEIKENSARFTDSGLLNELKTFAERSVRQKLVAYPYWENTAVILVDRASLLYVFKLIPIVLLVLLAAAEIILGYINRRKILRFFLNKISTAWKYYKQNRRHKLKEPRKLRTPAKRPALKQSNAAQSVLSRSVPLQGISSQGISSQDISSQDISSQSTSPENIITSDKEKNK